MHEEHNVMPISIFNNKLGIEMMQCCDQIQPRAIVTEIQSVMLEKKKHVLGFFLTTFATMRFFSIFRNNNITANDSVLNTGQSFLSFQIAINPNIT